MSTKAVPKRGNLTLSVLLVHLANGLLSLRMLLAKGYAPHAASLLRSQMELGNLLLALVSDESVHGSYLQWTHEPENSVFHWSKYLKPKKVRDVTLRAMRSCGVPEEMSLELVRGNEFAYQQLSGYVHGNLAAMTLSAFTAEGKKIKPTFGGSMTEYTRTVANQMVNFWFILLQSLCKILRDVHGWCPDESLEPSYRDMALAGTFQSAAVVALARRSRKRKLEQGD